jgi:hypothetical protein
MWKVTFQQDTEIKGTGTVTASFEDANTLPFSHGGRVNINNTEELVRFCQEAKAIKDKSSTDLTEFNAIVAKILGELEK